MFNVGGPEFVVILLVALVVLGPQRLPDALRQVGKFVGEARKISTNFQNEVQEAMKDPVKKATGTELPKIPKNAKDVVDLAMKDPAKTSEATDTSESEPKKPDSPRFGSAEPAKPAAPAVAPEPTAPADPVTTSGTTAPSDPTVEPAQIASADDISNMFQKNGSTADGAAAHKTPGADEDADDAEVPMFGDR